MTTLNLDNIDLGSFGPTDEQAAPQVTDLVEQQRTRRASATVGEAFKVNPDEYAHNIKLSRQSGLPTDVVSVDPKAVETDLKLKNIDFSQMSKRSPNTAKFLTDFNNAAIAHDDIDVMEKLEGLFKGVTSNTFKPAAYLLGVQNLMADKTRRTRTFEGLGESINIGFDQQALGLLAKGTHETANRRDLLIPPGALPMHAQDMAPMLSIQMAERMGIRSDEELVQVKEDAITSLVTEIQSLQERRQALTPDDLNTIEQGVRSGVESLANMAPGFALTLASGGRAFPLLVSMGTQTYGAGYAEALANDLSPEDAHRYAAIDAAIEVGTELLPAGTLTRILTGNVKGKVSKEALKFAVQEMGTEQLATLGQSLNAYAFDLDEQLAAAETPQEMIDIQLQRQLVTAIATVVAGGTQATVAGTINKAVNSLQNQSQQQETQTQAEQQRLDELNEVAANSKLRNRDPEAFKDFIREAGNDSHVFVDAAQASLYMQDKDPNADPALQDLAARVREAATTGADISIPVEEFATVYAGTEHFDALRDSTTLSQDSVAPFRQEQVRQETQKYMSDLVAEAQENVSQYVESQEIFESVRDQLVDTGMVTPQNAAIMAQIVPAWAAVFAQKNGITVQEAYQRSGLRVEGPQTGRAEELAAQEAMAQDLPEGVNQATAQDFHAALQAAKQANPNGSSVALYDPEEYENMQLFTMDGGRVGFAIESDGNLAGVFKHPDSTLKGALDQIVPLAIEQGATQLNAFEGFLTEAYAKHGFKEVDRDPWDDQFAPEDWSPEQGRPDVVYMELDESIRQQVEERRNANQSARETETGPVQNTSRVRRSDGLLGSQGRPSEGAAREQDGSLQGLPRQVGSFEAKHNDAIAEVARKYMESRGEEYTPPNTYAKVDPERARRIAQAYDAMEHNPQDPEVMAAYDAMIEETIAQYQAALDAGLQVEFIDFEQQGDPYEMSPRMMTDDVVNNNHMWVFSTRDGFGSDEAFDPVDNPLLRETEFEISGQKALVNDLFRVVHDYFGHVKEGVGFRANGEENAWRAHSAMYSPLARKAMTTETRGQNSWVNYGPHGETNRTATAAETHYADQKIGLLPDFAVGEGAGDADVEVFAQSQPQPQAERNNLGLYSAVEQAVLDLKLPQWKKEDGTAKGKDVWAKIKSTGGIKKEELEWLGLEEYLTSRPDAPFTRDMVADYVRQNGVTIEEVVASEGGDTDQEFSWSHEVDDDSANWEHITSEFMDEFDRVDEWSEVEEFGLIDKDSIQDLITNQLDNTAFDDLPLEVQDLVRQREAIEEISSNQLTLPGVEPRDYAAELEAIDEQINTGMLADIRDELEELAEEAAREQYMIEPVEIWTDRETDISIVGNNDVGYLVRDPSGRAVAEVDEIYSFAEAEVRAADYAREQGMWRDEDDPEVARWEEYVTPGSYDNYRELKLTLPEIEGDFENDVHFADRNLLAFLRVTDRQMGTTPLDSEVELTEADLPGRIKVVQVDGKWGIIDPAAPTTTLFGKIYDSKQDAINGYFTIKPGKKPRPNDSRAFFIDEFQSDWHQDGRQKGYQTGRDLGEVQAAQEENQEQFHANGERIQALIEAQVENTDKETLRTQFAETLFDMDELDIWKRRGYATGDHPTWRAVVAFTTIHGTEEMQAAVQEHEALATRGTELQNEWDAETRGVPDAPFKGDAWMNLGIKRALIHAAENDYEAVAWADSNVLMDRWSERYQRLYETQYDTKMVSMVKKLTKQKPKHMNFDGEEHQHQELGYWVIKMTPELKEQILTKGFPLYQRQGGNTARGYFEPSESIIRLTEAADLSTFLHEFAHFMYEMELKAGGDTVQDIHAWFKRNAADVAREANEYIGRDDSELEQDTDAYTTEIVFTATFDDGAELTETIRGRDMAHALQRAERNYPGAKVDLLDQGDVGTADTWAEQLAESRKSDAAQRGISGRFNQDDTPDFTKPAPTRVTEEDVVAYLDNNSTGDQAKDKAIRRAVHEQFARGFETYLMEGKAPSVELRNAFRAFARWLTQIYRSIRGKLNVNLDDQMRQVFNRLLATEEQIKAAEARARYKPMFSDAAMAGMTEEEFAKYQEQQQKARDKASETLRDKLIKEITRQTRTWWKEEKADLVDEETVRLLNEQVYRARESLRGEQLKLDHATVKDMVGEQVIDKRGRKYTRVPPALSGMTVKGAKGVHPDEAAAFFGYGSGNEMLADLTSAPSLKEAADAAAEERMKALHGDILNDGSIEQQADEALQNEEKGRLLLTELKALAKANNVPTLDRQTVKTLAEEAIAKLPYRSIHPGKYRKAEIRAAQEAATELQAGNTEGAARAKARQVMNFYLGSAATDARNSTLKIVERMARYNKKQVREEIQKAEGGYWEQLVKILNRFEFRKSATLRAVDQVNQDINTWMAERVNEDGDALVLSPAVLNETYVTHWKNVPYGDLQGINDSVKNIEHVARYSNKLTRMGEEIEFKKLVQRWVDHMNTMPTRFQAQRTDVVKGRHWGRWAMAQMSKIPWMASWLDGGERVGLSHQILVQPFTDAYDAEIQLWKEVGNKVMTAIETRDKATMKRHNRKIFIPEIKDANNDGNLFGHQVLAVALNTGNQGNLRKMLLGEGWANPEDDSTVNLDNPKLQAVLKHMTKEDWDLVQLIWDQMETLYPQLAEVHRRTTGLVPPKVESTPVQTEFGTYRGGYYPVKYDANRDFRAEQNEEKLNAQTESMFGSIGSIQATVNASATNERTAYYAPIRLSLDVVPAHFQETIHYITHHDAVREVNKLIRNKDVANTIKAKIGPEEYAQLKPWLNDIAKDGREAPSKTYWESAMQRLRFGLTLGIMGFKASTGIIQISGLSNTAAEVGSANLLQSMRSILGRPSTMRDAWDFASSNSKVLNHRAKTMDREIKNAMQKLEGKRGIKAAVQEASMKHIALIQTYMVDLPSWHAAYIKSMKEHGDEQKAYQYADWLIENVQGSGATKDLAAIMRNQNEANRMFTMFMTFFSSLWNMERDLAKGARAGRYSPTTVAAKAMFMFTIPVLFEMLMRGEFWDADGEPEEDILQKVLTATALFPLQSVPYLRDIANGVFGDFGYNMSPLSQLMETGTRTIPEVVKRGFTDDEITLGQAKGASKFVGAAAGIPGVNQMWATGEHLFDVIEEGEKLTVQQLLFGPKKE